MYFIFCENLNVFSTIYTNHTLIKHLNKHDLYQQYVILNVDGIKLKSATIVEDSEVKIDAYSGVKVNNATV